jgi:hypothetical protein
LAAPAAAVDANCRGFLLTPSISRKPFPLRSSQKPLFTRL